MKKIYKTIGLMAIMLFSFYYTDKIAILMQNKSPIMKSIHEVEAKYTEGTVNAVVEGDYITPGIMGRMVNTTKSYVNMKTFGLFNEYYLIFDDVKPEISLEDHKDKIINKGNKEKKGVALLLEENEVLEKYFKENGLKASLLIKEKTFDKSNSLEQINQDRENYKNVESLLNKNNLNKEICYVKAFDKDFCIKNKKYLVQETISFSNSNLIEVKKALSSGVIILVTKGTTVAQMKLLLNEIHFKGLSLYTVGDLINEKKDS